MFLSDTKLHRDFILFCFILFCILYCLEATNSVKTTFFPGTAQQTSRTTRQQKILEFRIFQFKSKETFFSVFFFLFVESANFCCDVWELIVPKLLQFMF